MFFLVSVFHTLALKLEKRGPYKKLVASGPVIMIAFSPIGGGFAGFILAPFSLVIWTTGMVEYCPSFLPEPVFLFFVTALLFTLLGWPLSWASDPKGLGKRRTR